MNKFLKPDKKSIIVLFFCTIRCSSIPILTGISWLIIYNVVTFLDDWYDIIVTTKNHPVSLLVNTFDLDYHRIRNASKNKTIFKYEASFPSFLFFHQKMNFIRTFFFSSYTIWWAYLGHGSIYCILLQYCSPTFSFL